ncbi:hypothetical protein SH1V18_18420 [Vallitalea longa]|uniref:Uncharacterized protein n=1 Tax=Vallitalea longa TaxID=2936439 RepID=A0A9W5Y8V2_9FIRM|nr:family 43 glycosylhydrolase [Vallitalea longa]GKX29362.1 hypothetical protein SH1V18_18420 [Vallitalea longa]
MMIYKNGVKILDDNGEVLHAHGGQIFLHEGTYYWIGEDRRKRNKVSCYSSRDLLTWRFCNHILTLDSPIKKHYVRTSHDLEIEGQEACIGNGCNIERPKVIYNERTKQFVMWMHWEKPADYSEARCAIAVCDRVDGDYEYLGSFNPIGNMSRDCTLYKDDNGIAYFISSSRNNADIKIYRLSQDYLSVDKEVRTLWPGQYREAPTVFKRNGLYYMLTSACTGWDPNQSCYSYSDKIDGDWSGLIPIGDDTTYRSQPTCVLPIKQKDKEKTVYYYIGDRWGGQGDSYYESTYVILPMDFMDDKNVKMDYKEDVTINTDIS